MNTAKKAEADLGPTADEYAHGRMKIPVDALVGFEWISDDGLIYRTVTPSSRHLHIKGRVAYMHISSYTEIGSFGASHWYGSIRADIEVHDSEGPGRHSGYLGKNAPTKHARAIKLEATRPIRARERDESGRPLGKAGEMTTRLESQEQARELTVSMFLNRFGPGWVLLDDREAMYAEKPKVIARSKRCR